MKEISLNKVTYLRSTITSIIVDETKLEFKNGVAVAEADVSARDLFNESYTYKCMGLIDENFHEVYADSHHGNEIKERNLMFLPYNKNIIRCGDNDFIVEVYCGDDGASWTEYRHIRIVDGIPLMQNKLNKCQITNHENLVISGYTGYNRLYDVTTGEYITPVLYDIKESKVNTEVFDIVAKITSSEEKNSWYVEYLYFKINTKGQIVSKILSSLASDYIFDCLPIGTSVEEVINDRKEKLKTMEEHFKNMTLEFENNVQYLEEYSEDLKRSLKMENKSN